MVHWPEHAMEIITNMLDQNSQKKFYFCLFQCIYHDVVGTTIPQSEIEKDMAVCLDRFYNEGLGFFTKTLPSLGKAIDIALATGNCLQSTPFKLKGKTKLPAFCWTLIRQLFRSDGYPITGVPTRRDDDGAGSTPGDREVALTAAKQRAVVLKGLRQICFLFYKLKLPYTDEQKDKVIKDFVETDRNLPEISNETLSGHDSAIVSLASRLIRRILANADPYSGIPKHGPGAVATGEKSHEKHNFSRSYELLNTVFPPENWFYTNLSHLCDDLHLRDSLESLDFSTAKVVLVDKDSRGPRLISCEPLEIQWVQQALNSVLVDTIQNHRLTRGRVNFSSQETNRRLALEGSAHPYGWATLDMKEASDRVSMSLVSQLFPENWLRALYASRSMYTQLPDGQIISLNKFAPMGSAVCFPVEALCFWALSVSALHLTQHVPLLKAATTTYVYGDDIIVSSENYATIINTLPRFGLLLNPAKCCTAGPFKESCGMDAYEGFPVTPLRLKCVLSHTRNPNTLASYVAFSNECYDRGLLRASQLVMDTIQYLMYNRIPVVQNRRPSCIAFVRMDWSRRKSHSLARRRYNKHLQRVEYCGYALRSVEKSTDIEGWPLLLRLLTKLERRKRSPNILEDEDDDFTIPEKEVINFYLRSPSVRSITIDTLLSRVSAQVSPFPVARRVKLTRAWTPA